MGKTKSLFPALTAAIAGSLLILFATRWGIGVSPDSVFYLGSANNLSSGLGLTIPFGDPVNAPLIHHAPFYPALLASLAFVTKDVDLSARMLNGLIFAVLILLVGIFINRRQAQNPLPAFFAAVLILVSPLMIELHLMAWSEPLFLALTFAGFALLARYLETGRLSGLMWAALLASLALLTRYAGVAVVATGAIAIVLLGSKTWRQRFLHALIYGSLAVLPFLAWTARNILLSGSATNRELSYHLITVNHLTQGIDTLIGFITLPASLPALLKLLVVVLMFALIPALLVGLLRAARAPLSMRSIREYVPDELVILLLFIPVYFLFLGLSISFFDANTPLDYRILSPIYLAWLILLVYSASRVLEYQNARGTAVLAVFCLLLASSYMLPSYRQLNASFSSGLGFNHSSWRESALLAALRLPDSVPLVYSNVPEGIYLHTGIPAVSLPRQFQAVSQSENPDYAAQYEKMTAALHSGRAELVMFSSLRADPEFESELVSTLSLQPRALFPDGAIYAFTPEAIK